MIETDKSDSLHILLHLSFPDSHNVCASLMFIESIFSHRNVCVCVFDEYVCRHTCMDVADQKPLNPLDAYVVI